MKKQYVILGVCAIIIIILLFAIIVMQVINFENLNSKMALTQQEYEQIELNNINPLNNENPGTYLKNLPECSLEKMINGMIGSNYDSSLVEKIEYSSSIQEYYVLLNDCKRNIVPDVAAIINPGEQNKLNLTQWKFETNGKAQVVVYFQIMQEKDNMELSHEVGIVDFAEGKYTSIYTQTKYFQYLNPSLLGFNSSKKTLLWELDTPSYSFSLCEDESIAADADDATSIDQQQLQACIAKVNNDNAKACAELKPGIYEYDLDTGKTSLLAPRECVQRN